MNLERYWAKPDKTIQQHINDLLTHLETLKTIQENGLTIYNTQTNGMIRYSYVGEKGRFEVKFPNESATITTTNTK